MAEPIKLPDLTGGDDDKAMNELERAALKAARNLREFDTTVAKMNKAKMGVGFMDAASSLDKWKKGMLEAAAAKRKEAAEIVVDAGKRRTNKLAEAASTEKMVSALGMAETVIGGVAGGIMTTLNVINAAQKMFVDSQRAGMVASAAGASDQKDLVDDLGKTARLAGLWRMTEQQVGETSVALLGKRAKGFDEELATFQTSVDRGGTHVGGVLDMMATTWGQTGVSMNTQMEMLNEELRKGQVQFGGHNQGMRQVNQNLLDMSDASAATHTDLSIFAKNVMQAGAELTIFGKKTPEITRDYTQFAAAIQDGTMQMSTFVQIMGGFTKTATPQQMLSFGVMAASAGGKEGERFREVQKKGGTAAELVAGFRAIGPGAKGGMSVNDFRALLKNVAKNMGGKGTADMAELLAMMTVPGMTAGNVPEMQKFLEGGPMPPTKRKAALKEAGARREARAGLPMTTAPEELEIRAKAAAAEAAMNLFGKDGKPLSVKDYTDATKTVWGTLTHPSTWKDLIHGVSGKTGYITQAEAMEKARRARALNEKPSEEHLGLLGSLNDKLGTVVENTAAANDLEAKKAADRAHAASQSGNPATTTVNTSKTR